MQKSSEKIQKSAEKYYQEAISIPLYYGLSLEEQDQVVTELEGILL